MASLRTKAGFDARVAQLRRQGMADEYIARQITDDLYRETQDDKWHEKQHIIEKLVRDVPLEGPRMATRKLDANSYFAREYAAERAVARAGARKRKFKTHTVKVMKGLTRREACRRAIKRLRKDVRSCSYNPKTGIAKLK